ncbi:LysR family transcriptional regulator [Nicoliella spurrieriana]|uniref:LysR family transcriptional regulator n=1 Tax=Nicoliella spurrieriana TaxID=2925830 RepID=A0A976RSP9_9LACO|nr:LysR family transcriptional regulator [Nicoliella spurrieriana]UQS87109.1 LysR family transcriptional regulator [Nicoliella spurrieriana]
MISFAYRAFSAVVQEKSFYKAAKLLDVTPSAISHAINQLEKFLGFSVFIRNRSGVKLTADGNAVMPIIQDIINTQHRLEQEAANITGLNAGSVRLGAFSSVCINWLPQIISSFRAQYPDILITVDQDSYDDISNDAKLGTIDIGFTCDPIIEKLIKVPLVKDQIYCITPNDFIPINGKTITIEDVKHQSFILQRSDYYGDTKKVLDRYNVTNTALQFSIDDQSMLAMVKSKLGMGILPKLALTNVPNGVKVYPFDQKYYRTIYLVINSIQIKTPATRRMLNHIKEFIQKRYPTGILE